MTNLDLNFGVEVTPNDGKVNQTKSQQKQTQVEQTSLAKLAQFGSPEAQRVIATGYLEGNQGFSEDQYLRDVSTLNDTQIAAKYGFEAVDNQMGFIEQLRAVEGLKTESNTTTNNINDGIVSGVQGGANLAGAGVSLAASAWDALTAGPRYLQEQIHGRSSKPLAESVAEGMNWVNEGLADQKSDLSQRSREQFNLEQALDAQDREANFEKTDQSFVDQLAQEIEGYGDTLANLFDNPRVGMETLGEAAGSLGPMAKTIGVVAKASVTRGMSAKQAKTFLESEAGKAALKAESIKVVPTITALIGGGSAGMQARQEILSMSNEELMESPEYQKFIEDGSTPDQAKSKLAEMASRPAELTGITLGLLTGRLSAKFEANPLAVGSIKEAGSTIIKETVEEGLEEVSEQVSSNFGIDSAGIETSLIEGTGEVAAMGTFGGAGVAAAVQAPGATGKVLSTSAKGIGKGIVQAFEYQQDAREQRRDDKSEVGNKAMIAEADKVSQTVAELDGTPMQTKVSDAVYYSAEESADYIEGLGLQEFATPDGRLERSKIVEYVGQILRDKDQTDEQKLGAAITAASAYDKVRSVDSTDMSNHIRSLPKNSEERVKLEGLQSSIRKLEGSAVAKEAQEFLKNVTRENVEANYGDLFKGLTEQTLSEEEIEQAKEVIEVVGKYNPDVFSTQDYDMVLNQVGSGSDTTYVNLLKTNAKITETSDAAKAEIVNQQAQAGVEEGKRHRPKSAVREDILITDNDQNDLKSIYNHFRNITDNLQAGRVEEAKAGMKDYRNFAKSQINKQRAFNQAARDGVVNANEGGVSYQAYGPFGKFKQSGVWMNPRAAQSVALARDIAIDTQAVVDSVNSLLEAYPELSGGKPLRAPNLDPVISGAKSAPIESDPVEPTKAERRIRKDAFSKRRESLVEEEGEVSAVTQNILDEQKPASRKPKKVDAGESDSQTTSNPTTPTPITSKPDENTDENTDANAEAEARREAKFAAERAAQAAAEADAEATKTPETLTDLLPNLTKDKEGRNYLLQAFKFVKDKSSFLLSKDPFREVLAQEGLTSEQSKQIKMVQDTLLPLLTDALNKEAVEGLKKQRGGKREGSRVSTWIQDLMTGEADVFAYKNALSLNLRSTNEKGQGEFDPKIMQAFTMAVAEWMVETESKGTPFLKDEDIHKKMRLSADTNVTGYHRTLFKHGPLVQSALDQITQSAMDILSVTSDKDQPIKFTQGMLRSMSANVLEALTNADWLEVNAGEYTVDDKPVTWQTIKVLSDTKPVVKDMVEGLRGSSEVFKTAFMDEVEKPFYIGTPPKGEPQSKLGQSSNKTSSMEKKVVKRLQSTPHRFVAPMVEFVDAIGDNVFARLIGYKEYDPETTNETQAVSIDSKNKSILRSIEAVNTLMKKTAAYADGEGTGVYETDTFFDWKISSVGRLQQQGLVTPQGDKIAREMISATSSVLDLDNQEHQDALWLAVGQAFGLSIEKKYHEDSINEIQELMDSETGLKPAVDMMREWLTSGEMENADAFEEAINEAKDANGEAVEINEKAIHALITVARAKESLENGLEDKNAFGTALALEADGKTDGPINALINMGFGKFTEKQIQVMAKGGLFFSGSQMSLNTYIQGKEGHKGDGLDLYNVAAELFEQKLKAIYSADTPAILSVLDTFLPGFAFQENNFSIGRNLIKNPLTVFLYGSAGEGIAQKMSAAVTAEIYNTMTQIAERDVKWHEHKTFRENPELIDFMKQVFGDDIEKVLSNPVKGELSFKMQKELTKQIMESLGEPLEESLDEATGGLKEGMKTIRDAAQIQAIVFQDAYIRELKKIQGSRAASDLSEKEYTVAFETASQVAPIYFTDSQEFQISTSEKYSGSKTISESFSGNLSSGSTVPVPAEAGVKVQPFMVIGTGDGKMILNIYNEGGQELGPSLAVFDGIEMALDNIKSASLQINQGVWKGWQEESVATTINEGFNRFLRSYDFNNLSNAGKEKLNQLAKRNKTNIATMIKDVEQDLVRKAAQNRARKKAMARMNVWIDHMAGADTPFEHKGEVVQSEDLIDLDMLEAKLNEYYKEELAKERDLITEKRTAAVVQQPTAGLMSELKKVGTTSKDSNVVQVPGSTLVKLVSSKTEFSKDQKQVFNDLLKNNKNLDNFTFYFGTSDELGQIREDQYGLDNKKPIENGAMYPNANVAFIANGSPETMLHEILHVATVKALEAYYADPSSVSQEVADSVVRLENLMGMFEKMNFRGTTAEDKAAQLLQSELKKFKGKPVVKMAEFISWTLSNQNLIEIGKDTRVYSPLQKIGTEILKALKKLLGIKSYKGQDFFTNVKFQTEVLIRGSEVSNSEIADAAAETTSVFEQVYGPQQELTELETKFTKRITAAMEAAREAVSDRTPERQQAAYALKGAELKRFAQGALEKVTAEGFIMNQREKSLFMTIHASMMSGVNMNPSAQRKVYELYSHMIKNARPNTLGVLVGKGGIRKNAENRSDLLATFVALGMVHKPFQSELASMDGPKNLEGGYSSVDEGLRSGANSVINYITQSAVNMKKTDKDVRSQLFALEDALTDIQTERQTTAERIIAKPQEMLDDGIKNFLVKSSRKGVDFIKSKKRADDGRLKRGALVSAQFIAAMGSKETSAEIGDAMTKMLNETGKFRVFGELLADFRGSTKSNDALLNLVNKVRQFVDGMRQDYRETVPDLLAEKFSRKIDKKEWKNLFEGIAQTDLVTLGRSQTYELLSDLSVLPTKISEAEALVRELGGRNATKYLAKSNALAEWMVNRKVVSNNLLRNAEAISQLLGERRYTEERNEDLIEAIDDLTSLYALNKTSRETKDKLQELARTEEEGMRFLIGYQASTKGMETQRIAEGTEGNVSRLNGWKGYAPTSSTEGHDLIVRDDFESSTLVQTGYVRVGDYTGDSNEEYRGSRGYYQSTVGGRSAYRQGVAQTVHDTYQGVDPRTGRTRTGETAGYISGAKARLARSNRDLVNDNVTGTEQLIPIFSSNGKLVAYERTMDAEKREVLEEEKHMARMLGAWSGRIIEETMADQFNTQLIETLHETWKQAQVDGDQDEFVNVADPDIDDPVIKDAWDTMGWKLKRDAAAIFGRDTLMIKRDQVNDALGYHQASIRDAFTGTSRWGPEAQRAVKEATQAIMGDNAYKYMVKAEKGLSEVVSIAKVTIVVRSLVVIRDNIISNNLHLLTWGVGLKRLVTAQRDKFVEINQYVKNQERKLELNAELAAKLDDPRAERRIKAELQAIEDLDNSLSIKALIDAGEFSTVSESLTEADQAMRNGKLSEFFEYAAQKLPGAAQTGFKNFVITKDTALFQGLNRAVQYGDFVAKAVLYEHLMQNKGYTQKEALDVIKEEFVNYNRLPGRSRDYLESIGMMWFMNYKLRIMKVLVRGLRERPGSLLFYAGGVGPMADIDTVFSGSLIGAYNKGTLDYAFGPEMGWNGLFMNPWMNLFGR